MREARHGFSLLSDLGEEPEEGYERVVRSRKRQRRSTGGMSQPSENPKNSEYIPKMSKDEFKVLATDDKLVTLFELMSSVATLFKFSNSAFLVRFYKNSFFTPAAKIKYINFQKYSCI